MPAPGCFGISMVTPNTVLKDNYSENWQYLQRNVAFTIKETRGDHMVPSSDVKSIFGKALELAAPAERAAYLDQACGGDTTLRSDVEGLLDALAKANDFMTRPAG